MHTHDEVTWMMRGAAAGPGLVLAGAVVALAQLGGVERTALAGMLLALPLVHGARALLASIELKPSRAGELSSSCALVALAAALIGLGLELDSARCLRAGALGLGLSAALFVPLSFEAFEAFVARAPRPRPVSRAVAWLLCLLLVCESSSALVSTSSAPVELCLHLGFAALLCTLLSSLAWSRAPQLELT